MIREAIRDWQRRNVFRELVYQGDLDKDDIAAKNALRIVVLVRDDLLPPLHQGIQAAHACLALAAKMAEGPAYPVPLKNCYLILLGAEEWQMIEKIELARKKKKMFAMYEDNGLVDPEIGRPVWTATAFEPMTFTEVQRWFGNLRRSE